MCDFGEECHYAHGEADIRSVASTNDDDNNHDNGSNKGNKDDYGDTVYDPCRGRMDAVMNLPYNSTTKAAYFLVHAPDLDTLRRSYLSGYWGTSGSWGLDTCIILCTHVKCCSGVNVTFPLT